MNYRGWKSTVLASCAGLALLMALPASAQSVVYKDKMPSPPPVEDQSAGVYMDNSDVMPDPQADIVMYEPMAAVATQESKLLELSDAVAIGLYTNPEYGVVANNRRATDEELRQARGLYLPSVDVRGDTGVEYTDDPGTRGGADNDDEETLYRYDVGVTLTQLLFDGWESYYENERQEKRVLSASHRVRETAEFVGLDIVLAYLEVLRQRELLSISRQNVAEHIRILDQIEQSGDAGRTTEADVVQVQARLAQARADEASSREALRNAESTYRREVGDVPGELVIPLVPYDRLSASIESEVQIALHQSPTLDVFEADVMVANAEHEGSKGIFYPQVDLQLNARDGNNLGGIEGDDTSASALVVMNWNLYRGGIDTARTRELINREAQVKEERADAARGVENEVRQTWASMISSSDRAKQFAAQADANAKVVSAYKDQFDLNRRTLLDVLDAQNELFVSRSNTVNSEFLEMFAVYRLLAVKGELLATLGVDNPREGNPAIHHDGITLGIGSIE